MKEKCKIKKTEQQISSTRYNFNLLNKHRHNFMPNVNKVSQANLTRKEIANLECKDLKWKWVEFVLTANFI